VAHIEDKPVQQTCADQVEELIRQSFISAERLVLESAARMGVSPVEVFQSIPMIAMEIVQRMGNVSNAMTNASPTTLERIINDTDLVIRELIRRNKAHGKKD